MDKRYQEKLINTFIAFAILIVIPVMFGAGWLLFSWMPAFFTMVYLENKQHV